MTDRINTFTVVLEHERRDDEIEHTLNALRMVRGVLSVVPNVGHRWDEQAGRDRANSEWRERVLALLREAP